MSDGPYRSLPMSPRWKQAAKCAYHGTFSTGDIADALQQAVERDCRAELSSAFVSKVTALIVGPDEPGLFRDLPISDLNALHRECSSPMEAGMIRNAIDALEDGFRGEEAVQKAAEGCVSDRILAGARQIEEHIYRETSDRQARSVRSRLEASFGGINMSAAAQRLLRVPGAQPHAPAAAFAGLDDGVPL